MPYAAKFWSPQNNRRDNRPSHRCLAMTARDTSRLSSRSWPLPSWHSLFFPNHIKMFGRQYRFPHNGEPRGCCNIKVMSRR